ncbi:hypothetical protein ACHAXA_003350 [Cyclostephanos tholiformis]|uniref:Uncharacterized protein n=1 Tax=Cyclostephanos tholiformis TaxID=382380 RepID=A0ABD3RCK7_9STRA
MRSMSTSSSGLLLLVSGWWISTHHHPTAAFTTSSRRDIALRHGAGTSTTNTAAWLYVNGGPAESSSPFATPSSPSSSSSSPSTTIKRPREEQRRRRRRRRRTADEDGGDGTSPSVIVPRRVDGYDDDDVDDVVVPSESRRNREIDEGGIDVGPADAVVDRDPFEVWCKMRLGLGSGPGSSRSGVVYWVGSGSLYEAYTGKLIASFEGYDVGRGVRLSRDHARQLSRKIFWFRDPITGDVMTEYGGRPVRPIVYDAQVIDYHRGRRDDDDDDNYYDDGDDNDRGGGYGSITYSVEASLRKLKGAIPNMKITSRDVSPHQMMINVPVFLDVPVPESTSSSVGDVGQRRYRAWEFYDYNVDPSFPPDRPPTAVWCRQGSVPPFFDVDDPSAVLRFSGHRVDNYEELPRRMRDEIEEHYPHFVGPPLDLEEALRRAGGIE